MLAGDLDRADTGFDRALEVYRQHKGPPGRGTEFYYKAMIAASWQHLDLVVFPRRDMPKPLHFRLEPVAYCAELLI